MKPLRIRRPCDSTQRNPTTPHIDGLQVSLVGTAEKKANECNDPLDIEVGAW